MNGPEPASLSDEALVRRAQADPDGSAGRAAAAELLRRYRSRVYLWCRRHVRDHERALDLAQEALVKGWRKLPTFQGRSRFSSWLFAIARNRCLDALDSPRLAVDEEAELDELPASGGNPEVRVEEDEDEEGALALIRETLEPVEQRAIWLRCFEKMPVDEITRLLGLTSASGARGVLQSARRKLRAALERRGREEGRIGT